MIPAAEGNTNLTIPESITSAVLKVEITELIHT